MEFNVKPMVATVASALAMGFGTAHAADANTSTASQSGSANVYAQTTESAQGTAQRQQAAPSQVQRSPGMNQAPGSVAQPGRAAMPDARASRIIGMNVVSTTGNDLGEINDLTVDLATNQIHYAIIGHGGFLGMGEKEVAVPVSSLSLARFRNTLVTGITEQQLERAPALDRLRSDWNDPRLWSNIGQYYHRTLGMPGGPAQTARFQRASDIIGMEVLGATGDDIGEIEDIVVNLSNGQLHYAVLEFDRAWNPFDKLVALPMSAFRPQPGLGGELVLNMTREQIAQAPAFDRRQWPNLGNTTFRDTVAGWGMRDRSTIGMENQNRMTPAARANPGPAAQVTTILLVAEPEFLRLDANNDGKLSRDEAQTVARLTENWNRADLDNDGFLTREEIRQFSSRADNTRGAGTGNTMNQQNQPGQMNQPGHMNQNRTNTPNQPR